MSVMQAEISHEADEELVDAARAGHREAFDALANRHFGMVYAIGLARLGNRDQAEDLAQEVFLRAFLLLDQLDSRALFSHWLSRIARNLAIDWQRRGEMASRLLPMIPLDELPHEISDEKAADPRHEAANAEQTAALREALGRLSPEAREIVLLHYMEGISQHEIARRMGVNQSTVTRQIGRSLVSMRVIMESALRNMARGLSARPSAKVRTAAMGAIVLGLPMATRTSMAAIAAQSLQSGASAKVTGAAASSLPAFINASLSLLKTGGAVMGYGKVAAGIGIVAALGAGGYYYFDDSDSGPPPTHFQSAGDSIASTDPLVFKLNPSSGNRIVLRTESDTDSSYEFPKEIMDKIKAAKGNKDTPPTQSKMHMAQEMAITTLPARSDGGFDIEFETVGSSFDMDMGSNKMSGASGTLKKEATKPAGGGTGLDDSMFATVGKKLVSHFNAKGELQSIDGMEEALATLKSKLGNLPAPASGFMNGMFNQDATKARYQGLFPAGTYPTTPIKIGEKWESQCQTNAMAGSGGKGQINTFVGWRMLDGKRVAEIQFEQAPGSPPVTAMALPMNAKYDNMKQSGTMLFDPESGMMAQMDSKTMIDMSMDIPIPGQKAQKMKIHVNSTSKVSQVKEDGGKIVAAGT